MEAGDVKGFRVDIRSCMTLSTVYLVNYVVYYMDLYFFSSRALGCQGLGFTQTAYTIASMRDLKGVHRASWKANLLGLLCADQKVPLPVSYSLNS